MSWVSRVSSLRTALVISTSSLLLTSCQTIYGWADHVGSYMPVIGERCNHWQCFTNDTGHSADVIEQEADGTSEPLAETDADDAEGIDTKRPNTFTEERPPIIPPSTESGLPDIEQRGARKPFPRPY